MSVQTPSIPSMSDYARHLMTGDRAQCRRLIEQAFNSGVTAYDLLTQLIWPTMESLQTLHREDRIGRSVLGLANAPEPIHHRSGFRTIGARAGQRQARAHLLRQ